MYYEKLKPKRRRFVDEYLKDFKGGAAAERAGYTKNNSSAQSTNLLALEEVKMAIKEKQDELAKSMDIKREDMLESYIKLRDIAINRNQVANAIKANDSICKLMGFNEPEKQLVLTLEKIEIEIIDNNEDLETESN